MKLGSTILVTALLVGCAAPKLWNKAGSTQSDYNADSYACEKDSRQSGYFGTGLVGSLNMQNFFDRCMVARGWYLETQRAPTMRATEDTNPQGIGSKYN